MKADNAPLKIITAPSKYIQGPGALESLGREALLLGSRAICVSDKAVWNLIGDDVSKALDVEGLAFHFVECEAECNQAEINRIADQAERYQADVVIGLGGGKAIDLAKGVAAGNSTALIIAPTIASSDAPTTRVCVVYDENGALLEARRLPRNPDLVLVDTAVIARAPVRFLIAGIGDALVTKFEAEQCWKSGRLSPLGGFQAHTAHVLAEASYEVIRKYGVAAKEAASRGVVTEALEKIVEANTYLSGLGFENNGVAAAHGLTRGFSRIEAVHHNKLHGEIVAFGLLVQFILEKRTPDFLDDFYEFFRQIGLPYRLSHLGVKETDDEALRTIARYSCAAGTPMHNMSEPVDEDALIRALIEADRIGGRWESFPSA